MPSLSWRVDPDANDWPHSGRSTRLIDIPRTALVRFGGDHSDANYRPSDGCCSGHLRAKAGAAVAVVAALRAQETAPRWSPIAAR